MELTNPDKNIKLMKQADSVFKPIENSTDNA